MWDWLRRRRDRRRDLRRRFEMERDRRILGELDEGVKVRERREKYLISELRRIEQALQRIEQ